MKLLLVAMPLILPTTSMAEYLDVIEVKLNQDCTFSSYLAITRDFNEWGKANGYRSRRAAPT